VYKTHIDIYKKDLAYVLSVAQIRNNATVALPVLSSLLHPCMMVLSATHKTCAEYVCPWVLCGLARHQKLHIKVYYISSCVKEKSCSVQFVTPLYDGPVSNT
jgi:hypothetical protein